MIKKFIFIFALSVGLQAFSISIDQPSIFLETKAGSQENFNITVTNKNSFPIKVKVYAQDWQYTEQGSKAFLSSTDYGLTQWLELPQPQEFQLEAFAEKKLKFTLKTPLTAQGGRVGVIFFQSSLQKNNGLAYSARIGSIIYQHTKDKSNYQMKLVKANYFKDDSNGFLNLAVTNTGDGYNFLQGTATLLDTRNKPLQSQNFKIQALPEDRQSLLLKFPLVDSDKVIITAEDLKGQIVSQMVYLNSEDNLEKHSDNDIIIDKINLIYNQPSLKVFLKASGTIAQNVTAQLKILSNEGKTIKTISLGKKFLESEILTDFTNSWDAGTYLTNGVYPLKLEFLDNSNEVLTELNIGQLTKNQQTIIFDLFDINDRKLKI